MGLPTGVMAHKPYWKFTTWVITINLKFLPHMHVFGYYGRHQNIFNKH